MSSACRGWLPTLAVCCLLWRGLRRGRRFNLPQVPEKGRLLQGHGGLHQPPGDEQGGPGPPGVPVGARESLLINPFDIHLFGRTAYERKGKNKLIRISLTTPDKDKEPEVLTTRADLDSIKVIPGVRFSTSIAT